MTMLKSALACLATLIAATAQAQMTLTPDEARAIAKEAYIYGYPLVDSYRINHSYFVASGGSEFKASWNQLNNTARVYTPGDKAIQTPNSDTPYSQLGMDLRAEPLVLTVPPIEKDRYFSIQLIDGYTFNFDYIGSRTTGNDGGSFLVAGPAWRGEVPKGIKKAFRSETDFAWALYRTQLFDAADIDRVKAVQAGYKVQTLSAFLGTAPPPPAAKVEFIPPLSVEAQRSSPEFFDVLNFVLTHSPTDPSEVALRERFARLGITAGRRFVPADLPTPILQAVKDGMADAWAEFGAFKTGQIDTLKVTSGDLFGTREYLRNNYLYRMAGAVLGIYGNSKQEAMYPAYLVDTAGAALDGGKNAYTIRFAPDQMPPANAFWSLTMYELPASLLYANGLNRYLINSPMLPNLKRDPDGGLTLFVQHEAPAAELQSNWLPAPAAPFWAVLRIYWPKETALDGTWKQPPMTATPVKAGSISGPVKVTPQTYIRAETDRSFLNIQALAGGINRFYHFRSPTPLDGQTVVRMNRDTLYSAAIVDTSKGASITIPKVPAGRFISALIIDNDHYAPAVHYEPGTYALPQDTKYVLVAVRTQLINPKDPAEVALVNAIQDQLFIQAGSADPMPPSRWDQDSLKALTQEYEKQSKQYASWKGMMGPRGTVDEKTRHIAAAAAWGLNPDKDATYLNYGGQHDPGKCYMAAYKVPENNAFWSITLYGEDGYMKSENNILNSSTARLNGDGTFTAYFGSKDLCGDVQNRLDVAPGWNFLMRIYRPGPSVLDGSYTLPAAMPVR
jgi:hypothetical protein